MEFARHYYFEGGATVTLAEMGHLSGIIRHYSETLGVYNRVNNQIIARARQVRSGRFDYDFKGSYPFRGYNWVFGDATVSGVFSGEARLERGVLHISGSVKYEFRDRFTDPTSIRERFVRTSDPDAVEGWVLDLMSEFGERIDPNVVERWIARYFTSTWLALVPEGAPLLARYIMTALRDELDAESIANGIIAMTDLAGIAFEYVGEWRTIFEAAVSLRPDRT